MRLVAFALAVMATFASFGADGTDKAEESSRAQQRQEAPSSGAAGFQPGHHHFALKSNMLFDAALMPNLELEWLISPAWSVALEGDVAWWKFSDNKIYRLAVVSPEVRYHIRPSEPWRGMYVGLLGGIGKYQLERPRHDGYRGEGVMGGVSFGYMWPVGRHIFLEAAVGVGYLHTRYKVYRSQDGHKIYLRTKTLNYFGPLKLEFSIAWRFDLMNKTVKDSSTL